MQQNDTPPPAPPRTALKHKQAACYNGIGGTFGCDNCNACHLAICTVCGGAEGTLTTDCPGVVIGQDIEKKIYDERRDYTTERGWHTLALDAFTQPRFEKNPDPEPACRPTAHKFDVCSACGFNRVEG